MYSEEGDGRFLRNLGSYLRNVWHRILEIEIFAVRCRTSGCDSGGYEEFYLLGYNAV
jgi:hypothetical protein